MIYMHYKDRVMNDYDMLDICCGKPKHIYIYSYNIYRRYYLNIHVENSGCKPIVNFYSSYCFHSDS